MSVWSDQIEADLKWREGEIASLKLLIATSQVGGERQRALLRALWAMLYAHYEGFCKFCWDVLLDAIENAECPRSDLRDEVARFSMAKEFRRLRGDTSIEGLWRFFKNDLVKVLEEKAEFSERLETRSNLWPSVAIANNAAIGLNCTLFGQYEKQLKNLVARRNEIAHGKKLLIGSLPEYQEYENAAYLVMHELAVVIVQTLEEREYMRERLNQAQIA